MMLIKIINIFIKNCFCSVMIDQMYTQHIGLWNMVSISPLVPNAGNVKPCTKCLVETVLLHTLSLCLEQQVISISQTSDVHQRIDTQNPPNRKLSNTLSGTYLNIRY